VWLTCSSELLTNTGVPLRRLSRNTGIKTERNLGYSNDWKTSTWSLKSLAMVHFSFMSAIVERVSANLIGGDTKPNVQVGSYLKLDRPVYEHIRSM
jgi:hypothetical protein